jgi:hypothetical protein
MEQINFSFFPSFFPQSLATEEIEIKVQGSESLAEAKGRKNATGQKWHPFGKPVLG